MAYLDIRFRYTKMGYAGNREPQHIVPTAVASKEDITAGDFVRAKNGADDLDFYTGYEVSSRVATAFLQTEWPLSCSRYTYSCYRPSVMPPFHASVVD